MNLLTIAAGIEGLEDAGTFRLVVCSGAYLFIFNADVCLGLENFTDLCVPFKLHFKKIDACAGDYITVVLTVDMSTSLESAK